MAPCTLPGVHSVQDVEPKAAVNLPVLQASQLPCPFFVLNRPMSQGAQTTDPSWLYFPSGHMSQMRAVPLRRVVFPAGQEEQVSDPTSLIFPISQLVQFTVPAWLNLPAVQVEHAEDPLFVACLPAGQEEQASAPVLPVNLPGSQGKHPDCPVPPWYLPGPHDQQLVQFVPAAYVPVAHASQLTFPGSA